MFVFSISSAPLQDDETISPSDTNPIRPKATLRSQSLPQPPSLFQGDETGKTKCIGKVLLKQLEAVAAAQQNTVNSCLLPAKYTGRIKKTNRTE